MRVIIGISEVIVGILLFIGVKKMGRETSYTAQSWMRDRDFPYFAAAEYGVYSIGK